MFVIVSWDSRGFNWHSAHDTLDEAKSELPGVINPDGCDASGIIEVHNFTNHDE